MARIVFDCAASLISELAEVDLERVRRAAEHVDVCARAKDPRLQTRYYNHPHFRMLETESLHGIGQFDIDAEVVRIELKLVAVGESLIFLDVHREFGHCS